MARNIVKSITIGITDTTVDDLGEVAALIGAPSDARVHTNGGGFYLPITNEQDPDYPYSVTFTWVDTV